MNVFLVIVSTYNYTNIYYLYPIIFLCVLNDIGSIISNTNTINNNQMELISMNMMIARVLSKVENIEKLLLKTYSLGPKKLDQSFLSQFPVCNEEQFILINSCINDDPEFVSKLVSKYNLLIFKIFLLYNNVTILILLILY